MVSARSVGLAAGHPLLGNWHRLFRPLAACLHRPHAGDARLRHRLAGPWLDQDRDVVVDLHLDQDRQGLPGSPDLARAILDKIDKAAIFVADVTTGAQAKGTKTPAGKRIKGRRFINPNVAIELGYALRSKKKTGGRLADHPENTTGMSLAPSPT